MSPAEYRLYDRTVLIPLACLVNQGYGPLTTQHLERQMLEVKSILKSAGGESHTATQIITLLLCITGKSQALSIIGEFTWRSFATLEQHTLL